LESILYHICDMFQLLTHHHTTIFPSFWPKVQSCQNMQLVSISKYMLAIDVQPQSSRNAVCMQHDCRPTRPICTPPFSFVPI
jgi:hypothetical protein